MRYPVWSEEFVFPPLSFLLWSCLSEWGKTGNLSLWISPHITTTTTTTTTAYCWCKALKVGIPTTLSLRETANPPTVQPLAGSQTDQALGWRDYSCSPSCVMQANGTSAGRRAVQQVQRRPPLVHLSRGRTGRWGGWGWGANTALRTKGHCLALLAS